MGIVVGGTKLFHFTTGATYLDIGNFVVQLGIPTIPDTPTSGPL
jgi:hypothetical protein